MLHLTLTVDGSADMDIPCSSEESVKRAEIMLDTLIELGAEVTAEWSGALFTPISWGVCCYCRMGVDEDTGFTPDTSIKLLTFDISEWAENEGYPYADRGCVKHADDMRDSVFCWVHDC